MPQEHEKLDYVEFPSSDFEKTKAFFSAAFGWSFTEYGDEYIAFDHQGLEGGFHKSDKTAGSKQGAPLLVFYSSDLEATQAKIDALGATIIVPTFDFPGGRRFHFTDPTGNEFAVWSDKPA